MRTLPLCAALAAALVAACGQQPARDASSEAAGAAERVSPPPLRSGPDGDMAPGPILRIDDEPGALPPPAAGDAEGGAPPSREQLLAEARTLAEGGALDDAVSIYDTLIVLDPDDAEALEARARALSDGDRGDGAARDLERCCALGRASCCPPPGPAE